jgi:hypothetical protein
MTAMLPCLHSCHHHTWMPTSRLQSLHHVNTPDSLRHDHNYYTPALGAGQRRPPNAQRPPFNNCHNDCHITMCPHPRRQHTRTSTSSNKSLHHNPQQQPQPQEHASDAQQRRSIRVPHQLLSLLPAQDPTRTPISPHKATHCQPSPIRQMARDGKAVAGAQARGERSSAVAHGACVEVCSQNVVVHVFSYPLADLRFIRVTI